MAGYYLMFINDGARCIISLLVLVGVAVVIATLCAFIGDDDDTFKPS